MKRRFIAMMLIMAIFFTNLDFNILNLSFAQDYETIIVKDVIPLDTVSTDQNPYSYKINLKNRGYDMATVRSVDIINENCSASAALEGDNAIINFSTTGATKKIEAQTSDWFKGTDLTSEYMSKTFNTRFPIKSIVAVNRLPRFEETKLTINNYSSNGNSITVDMRGHYIPHFWKRYGFTKSSVSRLSNGYYRWRIPYTQTYYVQDYQLYRDDNFYSGTHSIKDKPKRGVVEVKGTQKYTDARFKFIDVSSTDYYFGSSGWERPTSFQGGSNAKMSRDRKYIDFKPTTNPIDFGAELTLDRWEYGIQVDYIYEIDGYEYGGDLVVYREEKIPIPSGPPIAKVKINPSTVNISEEFEADATESEVADGKVIDWEKTKWNINGEHKPEYDGMGKIRLSSSTEQTMIIEAEIVDSEGLSDKDDDSAEIKDNTPLGVKANLMVESPAYVGRKAYVRTNGSKIFYGNESKFIGEAVDEGLADYEWNVSDSNDDYNDDLDAGGGTITFNTEGNKNVSYKVITRNGDSDSDSQTIKVLPTPFAVIDRVGSLKENRKITIDISHSISKDDYSINWDKAVVELIDLDNSSNYAKVKGNSYKYSKGCLKIKNMNNGVVDFLSKDPIKRLKIKVYVEDTLGESNTKEKVEEIVEDEPPLANLVVADKFYRDTLKVRYIRDKVEGNTTTPRNHWVEIQAIDINGNNVALGKTASNIDKTDPDSITDGNTSTSHSLHGGLSVSADPYVYVDLGQGYSLDKVKIWHYYKDSRTYHKTKTQISEDGITWYTIFDSNVEGEYVETSQGHTIDVGEKVAVVVLKKEGKSIDGDNLKVNILKYRIDRDNDGNFSEEPWKTLSTDINEKEVSLCVNDVGKIQFYYEVQEDLTPGTISDFVSSSDYLKNNISKVVNVDNLAPRTSLNVINNQEIDLMLIGDKTKESELTSRANTLKNNMNNSNIPVNLMSKTEAAEISDKMIEFIQNVSPLGEEYVEKEFVHFSERKESENYFAIVTPKKRCLFYEKSTGKLIKTINMPEIGDWNQEDVRFMLYKDIFVFYYQENYYDSNKVHIYNPVTNKYFSKTMEASEAKFSDKYFITENTILDVETLKEIDVSNFTSYFSERTKEIKGFVKADETDIYLHVEAYDGYSSKYAENYLLKVHKSNGNMSKLSKTFSDEEINVFKNNEKYTLKVDGGYIKLFEVDEFEFKPKFNVVKQGTKYIPDRSGSWTDLYEYKVEGVYTYKIHETSQYIYILASIKNREYEDGDKDDIYLYDRIYKFSKSGTLLKDIPLLEHDSSLDNSSDRDDRNAYTDLKMANNKIYVYGNKYKIFDTNLKLKREGKWTGVHADSIENLEGDLLDSYTYVSHSNKKDEYRLRYVSPEVTSTPHVYYKTLFTCSDHEKDISFDKVFRNSEGDSFAVYYYTEDYDIYHPEGGIRCLSEKKSALLVDLKTGKLYNSGGGFIYPTTNTEIFIRDDKIWFVGNFESLGYFDTITRQYVGGRGSDMNVISNNLNNYSVYDSVIADKNYENFLLFGENFDDRNDLLKFNIPFKDVLKELVDSFNVRSNSQKYAVVISDKTISFKDAESNLIINQLNSKGVKCIWVGNNSNKTTGQKIASSTGGTYLYHSSYADAFNKIESYLKSQLPTRGEMYTLKVKVGDTVEYDRQYFDAEGDSYISSKIKWRYRTSANVNFKDKWLSSPITSFSTPGTYYVSWTTQDNPPPANTNSKFAPYRKDAIRDELRVVVGNSEVPKQTIKPSMTIDVRGALKANRKVIVDLSYIKGSYDINYNTVELKLEGISGNTGCQKFSKKISNTEYNYLFKNSSDTKFRYKVRIRDVKGNYSDWVYSDQFTVKRDLYPTAGFKNLTNITRDSQGVARITVDNTSFSPDNPEDYVDIVTYYVDYNNNNSPEVDEEVLLSENSEIEIADLDMLDKDIKIFQKVKEGWSQDTISEFVSNSDYLEDTFVDTVRINDVIDSPTLNVDPKFIIQGENINYIQSHEKGKLDSDGDLISKVEYHILHSNNGFDNFDLHEKHNKIFEDRLEKLDNAGKYTIKYRYITERGKVSNWSNTEEVIVHRPPIPGFNLPNGYIQDNVFMKGVSLGIESTAYDLDHTSMADKGIADTKYYIKKALEDDSNYTEIPVDSNLVNTGQFTIKQEVIDVEGATGEVFKTINVVDAKLVTSINPSVQHAGTTVTLRAEVGTDCKTVVAVNPLKQFDITMEEYITLDKVSSTLYEKTIAIPQTTPDSNYDFRFIAKYPYLIQLEDNETLTVNTPVTIESDIKPLGPDISDWNTNLILEDNNSDNDYIKAAASENIKVEATVNCPISISQVEAWLEGEGSSLLSYNSASGKWEGTINVRSTKVDKNNYPLKVRATAINNSYAENTHRSWIYTPIKLTPNMPSMLISNFDNLIKSTTTKYANSVKVTLFRGTAFQTTITLNGTINGNIKEWSKTYLCPSNIPEGDYVARFTSTTPNGNTETKDVNFKLVSLNLENFRITDMINHPQYKGKYPIYYTSMPAEYKAGYKVTFDIDALGTPDEVKLKITYPSYNETFDMKKIASNGNKSIWQHRWYAKADTPKNTIINCEIWATKGTTVVNFNNKYSWDGNSLKVVGSVEDDLKVKRSY